MTTAVSGAEPLEVGNDEHVPARVARHAREYPDRAILAVPSGSGWRELSWAEVSEQVSSAAAGLVASGVEPGDRVALMSGTRLEWTLADLAILSAGAVTVPLYETSSVDQVRGILDDCGARLALAADGELADRLRAARDIEVLTFDDGGFDALLDRAEPHHRDQAERRIDELTTDDVATIVYTSGTTGDPKGCVLTHGNLAWTTTQTRHHLDEVLREGGTLLQILPLAHIFARVIQFVCLDASLMVGFAGSPKDPREDIRSFQPTLFVGVPRVFEKVFEASRRQAEGRLRQKMFDFAVAAAQARSRTEDAGALLRLRHRLADRLVFARLRAALGGRIEHSVSGGAPLSPDLVHFFRGAGVPILEGYGLTETTGPATVNAPGATAVGSVGRPLPGVELRIDDGELLVRGGNVFQRYYHHSGRSAEDFDGDWFRTGDLGELDEDGYLHIRERKKEVIVTATGKNVAPAPLEDRVAEHPLVSRAMLIGDSERFIAALVTLDTEELERFAVRHGRDASVQSLRHDDDVRAAVQGAVDEANQLVSRSESIREFVILDRDFSEEEGELTPTLKLRRRDIVEHFSDEIASIYD